MSPRPTLATLVFGAALAVAGGSAEAHPLVDDARRLVDEADFSAAERAFARAEGATDLTREDLALLLEGRALLHHALADAAALEADLARLAALDPQHTFGPRMPPEIAETFLCVRTRAPGALRVEVEMRPVPGGLALRATAANDAAGIVRALEMHARVAGGPWRSSADELVITGAPGASVELWAVARGPGGVAVATRGSEAAPVAALVPGAEHATPETPIAQSPGPEAPPPRRSSRAWIWVTVAGVGLAAVVTAGLLVFFVRSDDTIVDAPELRGQ